MGFTDSIKANSDKMLESVNSGILQIAADVFTKAVEYSPSPLMQPEMANYSIGTFINNWFVAENSLAEDFINSTSSTGVDSLSRINSIPALLTFYGKDGMISLTNNSSYSAYVENLGWQAGEGTNGWVWTGNQLAPYAPVFKAMSYASGNYK